MFREFLCLGPWDEVSLVARFILHPLVVSHYRNCPPPSAATATSTGAHHSRAKRENSPALAMETQVVLGSNKVSAFEEAGLYRKMNTVLSAHQAR